MEFLYKSSLLLALFYLFYTLFLQHETFFKTIRVYLIVGIVLSLILPNLVIPIYTEQETPIDAIVPFDISNFQDNLVMQDTVANHTVLDWDWQLIFLLAYVVGFVFFFIKLVIEFNALYRLIRKAEKENVKSIVYANIKEQISPFSIWNYIVFNRNQFTANELAQVLAHEKVHVYQKHSLDLFLANIMTLVFWFNPFSWLYKKKLQENLEFLADKYTVNQYNKKEYQYLLLKESIKNYPFALSTNFYQSLIKKRIIMLQKSKSKKVNQLKYLLLIPVLSLFLYSFNTKEISVSLIDNYQNKTVLIDVAHGGIDHGGIAENTSEKELVLAIAKKIKSLNNDNINIVFSREDDTYLSLNDRIKYINKINPDLVISLHVNIDTDAETKNQGIEAYFNNDGLEHVASNLLHNLSNKALPFNAIHQNNRFSLLRKVKTDVVLLELGSISNTKELNYLVSKNGQLNIASGIVNYLKGIINNNPIAKILKEELKSTNNEGIIITITKSTTEEQLVSYVEKFAQEGLKFTYSGVKRNANNEIKAIKISLKNSDGSQSQALSKSANNGTIDKIILGILEDEIFIKSSSDGKVITLPKNTYLVGTDKGKVITFKREDAKTIKQEGLAEALYVLDGIIIKASEFKNIDKDKIKKINVLKGDKAIAKYGKKGKLGVIELYTYKVAETPKSSTITITKLSNNDNEQIIYETEDNQDSKVTIIKDTKDNSYTIITKEKDAKNPLPIAIYFIDGKETAVEDVDMDELDIKSMHVYKGKTALAKFGKGMETGVIEIITDKQAHKTGWVYYDNATYYYTSKLGNYHYYNRYGEEVNDADLLKQLNAQKKDTKKQEKVTQKSKKGSFVSYKGKKYFYNIIDGELTFYDRYGNAVEDKKLRKKLLKML